jgi:hypothetical protein
MAAVPPPGPVPAPFATPEVPPVPLGLPALEVEAAPAGAPISLVSGRVEQWVAARNTNASKGE